MCGRYTLTTKDFGEIAEDLGARWERELGEAHVPRYNVAPTQIMPIARLEPPAAGEPWLRAARWGFVAGRAHINARSERAATAPAFREAFANRRCVVPADGFLEWRAEGAHKQPVWFHAPAGGLLWLAGLWTAGADGVPTYLILTTAPSALVREVHDRMPVVLSRAAALHWLAHADASILAPAPDDALVATPVSSRVSNARHDDPACLEPPPPPSQGRLF